jgi:hypothetical protein
MDFIIAYPLIHIASVFIQMTKLGHAQKLDELEHFPYFDNFYSENSQFESQHFFQLSDDIYMKNKLNLNFGF